SASFARWAPRLHKYYGSHFDHLLDSDQALYPPFSNSVWAAATFNFGPQTLCYPHVDYANLPFGWCSIWALGNFDSTKGGHLILWDLNLAIEFPAGSCAFIPSGACRHSNAMVRSFESRYSFTQFSAGGLFRWVDHGFKTEEAFKASLTREEAELEAVQKRNRWQMGLNLFSTLEELGIS
ncbi:hypothetical protein K435DRAFT_669144, partial [Dendrothele bispora CBS 962.96]